VRPADSKVLRLKVRLRKVEEWRKKNGVEDKIGRGAGRESERIEEGRDGVETAGRRRGEKKKKITWWQ